LFSKATDEDNFIVGESDNLDEDNDNGDEEMVKD
jgi:hypothetical protein